MSLPKTPNLDQYCPEESCGIHKSEYPQKCTSVSLSDCPISKEKQQDQTEELPEKRDKPLFDPNEEIEIRENGAIQSKVAAAYELVPPQALDLVAHCLAYGAEVYGEDNWKGLPPSSHLRHALSHIYKFLSGDKHEHHLAHAATRLLMGLEAHVDSLEVDCFYWNPNSKTPHWNRENTYPKGEVAERLANALLQEIGEDLRQEINNAFDEPETTE